MIEWHIKTFEELTTTELYKFLQLRTEVFVVEQEAAYQDLDGKDLDAIHIWGVMDDTCVAYTRTLPFGLLYPNSCSLGRVVTHPEYRNQSLGRKMMTIALDVISKNYGDKEIRISAQSYLEKFYTSFGFISTDKRYLEDGLPHVEMYKIS